MASSRFSTTPGPRPTPQTCFPPPPPQPNPGHVACANGNPTNYIRAQISFMWFPRTPRMPPFPRTTTFNMAYINWSYGLTTFATYFSNQYTDHFYAGLRCNTTNPHQPRWEGRVSGTLIDPDGNTVTNSTPWAAGPLNEPPDPKYELNVKHMIDLTQRFRTAKWYASATQLIWQNVPDQSRSRPPNPPIPELPTS